MLDWLKDVILPVRRHDPRFGAMRYLRAARFWEGKANFRATGERVEVLLCGNSSGPTSEQRIFFDELQETYESLWPLLREKLATEARKVGVAASEFELVCVTIPEQPGPEAEWEMSYQTRPLSWHFTIRLRGRIPGEIVAEC